MSKTFILIDNNLLRKVYSKDDGDRIFSSLYETSLKLGLPDIRGQEAVVTPFSLIEAIGFGKLPSVSAIEFDVKKIEEAKDLALDVVQIKKKLESRLEKLQLAGSSPDSDVEIGAHNESIKKSEKEISELIENVRTAQFKRYLEFFSGHKDLSAEALQLKYQEQCKWLSKLGKDAFKLFFEDHIKTKKDTDYIAQFLAFDAIYKFDWPQELRSYRDVHIVVDLFRSLKDDVGVMQTRGLKYLWHNFSEVLLKRKEWTRFKRTEEEFREEIATATDAIDLKTREDLLDTEMFQFLVTGKMHDQVFAPVYVYTMEAPEKFTSRLTLMKTLINSSREALKPEQLELANFSPGFVVFVSGDGKVIKSTSVEGISPFLADRE